MKNATVLIVEDDLTLAAAVAGVLADAGFATARATDGQQALQAFFSLKPDIVLLDLGLPLLDGQIVIERLRDLSPTTPIVVLSARAELSERVRALQAGADDFIPKPFSNEELVARLQARLRNNAVRPQPEGWRAPIAPARHEDVDELSAGLMNDLTRLEQGVFDVLAEHRGALVPAEEILQRVWGESSGEDRIRYVVKRLRRKLAAEPQRNLEIRAVHGRGYRLVASRGANARGFESLQAS